MSKDIDSSFSSSTQREVIPYLLTWEKTRVLVGSERRVCMTVKDGGRRVSWEVAAAATNHGVDEILRTDNNVRYRDCERAVIYEEICRKHWSQRNIYIWLNLSDDRTKFAESPAFTRHQKNMPILFLLSTCSTHLTFQQLLAKWFMAHSQKPTQAPNSHSTTSKPPSPSLRSRHCHPRESDPYQQDFVNDPVLTIHMTDHLAGGMELDLVNVHISIMSHLAWFRVSDSLEMGEISQDLMKTISAFVPLKHSNLSFPFIFQWGGGDRNIGSQEQRLATVYGGPTKRPWLGQQDGSRCCGVKWMEGDLLRCYLTKS